MDFNEFKYRGRLSEDEPTLFMVHPIEAPPSSAV